MKKYEIFDDVLPFSAQQRFFEYIYKSNYSIGWYDRLEKRQYDYFHSPYSMIDVKKSNFFDSIINKKLFKLLKNQTLYKATVNVSMPHETYFVHSHGGDSLIYYPNMTWEQSWEGETFIYEDDGKTIHTCIPYTPNRVLWLKSNVAHSIRAPNNSAYDRRFTFACFFSDGNQTELQ